MTSAPTNERLADLALVAKAARSAGEIAMTFFGQSPDVWWKNEGSSPVSAADFAANDRLSDILRSARPDYGWLSEETDDDSARLGYETLFVVDPIDGTRAFIGAKKTWCVSVAVVHRGRPVAAALYAPALDEEFLAVADGAVTRNGSPISVAGPSAGPTRVATATDMLDLLDPAYRETVERVPHIPSLAYRLALIADGRIDATLVKKNSHDWDLAAADLLLERAGGQLVDFRGEPLQYNRAEVVQDHLCAGSATALPGLLQHLRVPRAVDL
ncbi:3'(2'),5'-bisphosphate nucleotidase CysQ [Agrobacterium sp. ES01]|uniref:3'(2'),5'-bisphosphate nucleotidase CysQ n=1 Tax=Agrobacterium sp. ES01 TaxID=3420714 RepID=UPI003D105040